MKRNLRRLVTSAYLCLILPLGAWSCSSAQEDDEGLETEEVASEEEFEENNLNAEENAIENEGNNLAEFENSENNGNILNDNPGLGNDPVENDLQQIISEMNNIQDGTLAGDGGLADNQQFGENLGTGNQGQFAENLAPDAGGQFAADGGQFADGTQQAVDPAFAGTTPPAAGAAPGTVSTGTLLPEMGAKMPYVVQGGDTLGVIAARIYGNESFWRQIADLTGLETPSRIYPGDVVYYQLNQQSLAFAQAYESATRGEVVVQAGDTLASISRQVYGASGFWKSIWRQNDTIDDPDRLTVGQTVYYLNQAALTAALEKVQSMNIAMAQPTGAGNVSGFPEEEESLPAESPSQQSQHPLLIASQPIANVLFGACEDDQRRDAAQERQVLALELEDGQSGTVLLNGSLRIEAVPMYKLNFRAAAYRWRHWRSV